MSIGCVTQELVCRALVIQGYDASPGVSTFKLSNYCADSGFPRVILCSAGFVVESWRCRDPLEIGALRVSLKGGLGRERTG